MAHEHTPALAPPRPEHPLGPGRVRLKSMPRPQFERWAAEALGASAEQAQRVWIGLYRHGAPDPASLRGDFKAPGRLGPEVLTALRARAEFDALTLDAVHVARDGTRKLLYRTARGDAVESVLIPGRDRSTLCISSQIGCAMGCTFCLTATMGLQANLDTAEIVDQVVLTRRANFDAPPISNIVFMGMGEPLHNVDNVIAATHILVDPLGLSLSTRRVTVSTSGIVPGIERLGRETRVQLAVSLNASTDETRAAIMPIGRKYPLARLFAALRAFPLRPRERITLEYVLLAGVNDSEEDAARVHELTRGLACKLNLIPFNPHTGARFRRPEHAAVLAFRDALRQRGVSTSIRETRGDQALAACGQLGVPGASPRGADRLRVIPPSP